jgi:Putative Actinobacterial Holin-X, holin superfamily III
MSSSFEPEAPQRPLSELFGSMTTELTTLFRQEVQLAKAEVRQEASKAGQAVAMLAGGAIAALIAALILAMAAGFGLAEIMPTGWAFAIIGVLIAIVAAVLVASGRKRLQAVSPRPDQTIETLKEDAATIRERRP